MSRRWLNHTRTHDVIVVGAGQSGLSTSYHLTQHGVDHVVLEKGEIGAAWLTRWDSFQLNTPNRYIRLAGRDYDGPDPDGFADRETTAGFMRRYAEDFGLPVVTNCKVIEARHDGGWFSLDTSGGPIRARALIVASGHYAQPKIPEAATALPDDVMVLHSRDYRSPEQLPTGAVMVVGGGQSGAQIAEELRAAGRRVFFCVSRRPCNFRRFRGEDYLYWWNVGGIHHRPIEEHPLMIEGKPDARRSLRLMDYALVSGTGGDGLGHSISYESLWEQGITLLGRFDGVHDRKILIRGDVRDSVAAANVGTRRIRDQLMDITGRHGVYDDAGSDVMDTDWLPPKVIEELDIDREGVTSVVLTTGFRTGWTWLKIPNLTDAMGYPRGYQGKHPIPGLYFLGLFNLQRMSSTSLGNGGRDAAVIVDDVVPYLRMRDAVDEAPTAPVPVRQGGASRILIMCASSEERSVWDDAASQGADLHFMVLGEGLDDCGADDLVAFTRRCIAVGRAVSVTGVVALDELTALAASVVAEALGLPGPGVNAVFRCSHGAFGPSPKGRMVIDPRNDRWRDETYRFPARLLPATPFMAPMADAVSDLRSLEGRIASIRDALADGYHCERLRFFQHYVDTIAHPLAERPVLMLDPVREIDRHFIVDGWTDQKGHVHVWGLVARSLPGAVPANGERFRVVPDPEPAVTDAALDGVREIDLRATFWSVEVSLAVDGSPTIERLSASPSLFLAPVYRAHDGRSLLKAVIDVIMTDPSYGADDRLVVEA